MKLYLFSELMREYGGFRLEGQSGNNVFAYQERMPDPKLWLPKLILAGLEKLSLGSLPVFAECDSQGKVQLFNGLQHFLFFEKNGIPIYIFDNHNHALAFRYRALFGKIIQKETKLIHLDQHSDMNENSFTIKEENWASICDFTQNCCNVGNFIVPALNSGLFSDVRHLRTEWGLLDFDIPEEDYVFDIDLDFWAEKMGIEAFEATLQKTKNLIASAKLVTIATSPYFLDQSKALKLIYQLFE